MTYVGRATWIAIGMAILLAANVALAEKPQAVSASTPAENDADFPDAMKMRSKGGRTPKPEKTGLSQPMPSSIDGKIWNGADV